MAPAAPAWEFPATGTRWRLYHSGGLDQAGAAAVAGAVARDEARWSRFRPDSEVSRLNGGAGRWQPASPDTLALLAVCRDWARRSDGVFTPLIGGALQAWGYEHSMADAPPYAGAGPAASPVRETIEVDLDRQRVWIPAGYQLDLGGVAKGWMAARAAAMAAEMSDDPHLLIDAGGDLAAATGEHRVAVEDPESPADSHAPTDSKTPTAAEAPTEWIRLKAGQGVATSGFARRRWINGDGRACHHLIDPLTGAPGAATHATVVAPDPAAADVMATVLAPRPQLAATCRWPARVQTAGETIRSPGWAEISVAA
jgi:thiamine biosynthesis lipoprotein